MPVSPSSSTEASLAAIARGEVEQARRCGLAAGRAGGGAEQLGGKRVAEGHVVIADRQAGRARSRGARRARAGAIAEIDDQIVGRGAGLLAGGEDREALGPAVLAAKMADARPAPVRKPASAGFAAAAFSLTPIISPPGLLRPDAVQAPCQRAASPFRPLARG